MAELLLRLAEPHEHRKLRCEARRGPRSRITCEQDALHAYGCQHPMSLTHVGRSRIGAWFFWPAGSGDGDKTP